MALEQHVSFAGTKGVDTNVHFPDLLIELVSTRPGVFAEAIETYSDLRSLIIRVVHEEFCRRASLQSSEKYTSGEKAVELKLRQCSSSAANQVNLPRTLLQSISVLLSIWNEKKHSKGPHFEAKTAINDFVDSLLRSDVKEDGVREEVGLASARLADSGIVAVPVEMVSVHMYVLVC